MFAKLYETEEHGQILVKKDDGDSGPEVRFFFKPKGLGVCSCAVEFDDNDEGWDKAEIMFKNIDFDSASSIVSNVISNIPTAEE